MTSKALEYSTKGHINDFYETFIMFLHPGCWKPQFSYSLKIARTNAERPVQSRKYSRVWNGMGMSKYWRSFGVESSLKLTVNLLDLSAVFSAARPAQWISSLNAVMLMMLNSTKHTGCFHALSKLNLISTFHLMANPKHWYYSTIT